MTWFSYLFWLYSWLSVLPWVCVMYYRYFHQANYALLFTKHYPKPDRLDKYILMLALPFGFYYVVDTIYLIFFIDSISACDLSYLSHHIVALIGTPYVITMPHYPWFVLFPYSWHSLLLMFPSVKSLNYAYVAVILLKVRMLHTEPWCLYRHYRIYRLVCYMMMAGPLVMLWYNRCSNNMSNVDTIP